MIVSHVYIRADSKAEKRRRKRGRRSKGGDEEKLDQNILVISTIDKEIGKGGSEWMEFFDA